MNSNSLTLDGTGNIVFADSGNITTAGDLAVNGGNITTTATTANIVNTTATAVNIGGASTATAIGAATGTTTIGNDLTATGDATVTGADLTLGAGTVAKAGTIVLHDADGADGFTTTLASNADVGADFTLTLPATAGSTGQVLTDTDGAGALGWTDAGSGAFSTTANVTSNAPGTLLTDNFVFGSTQLDDDTGTTDDDKRMFFDKSKGAFRAGFVQSTDWDSSNVGSYSFASGRNTRASGNYSVALCYAGDATGNSSATLNDRTAATGDATVAMGTLTTAQAYASLAIGRYNVITGNLTAWTGTDPVFVIGNGGSDGTRANALTVLKNGNMTVGAPTVGHITANGANNVAIAGDVEIDGNLWVDGTFNAPSDIRLKSNIETLSDVLTKINQIRGVRYEFKDQDKYASGPQIGLMAQELREVFPELVSEGADGYLGINYMQLSAVLIEAVNAQQTQIDALNDRLDSQQAQIDELFGMMTWEQN